MASESCGRTMTARYKGMKKYAVYGKEEFDCDRCISVARDFLLFYLNEHQSGKNQIS